MTNNNIVPINSIQSPFDSIRKFRADGSEYWIARELMTLMGYPRWQTFIVPIKNAIENLELNGDIVLEHFSLLTVKSSGRDGSDYELTRYASYMTALCCDGRKPEVAAAKKYFATKTREAETAPILPQDYEQALVALLDVVREKKALAASNQQLEQEKQVLSLAIAEAKPKAELYDIYISRDGWLTGEQIAKQLLVSTRKMFDVLRGEKIIYQRSGKNLPCADWVNRQWATMRPVRCHDEVMRSNLVFSHKAIMQIFDLLQDNGLIDKNRNYQLHFELNEPKPMKRA